MYFPRHYVTSTTSCTSKACNRRPIKCWWDVRQVGCRSGPAQHRLVARSPWLATVQSGSTTLGRQLRCNYNTVPAVWTTRQSPLQCTVTQQHDVMLLTMYGGAGDKTKRTHVIEDIICYSWLLTPYRIVLYLPQGHLSGLGARCNYPNLSYKRLG
jgi:hypothetical protein